jgi:hypothetical protein
MRNTAEVTGGKPIASQSISGVSAINPLIAVSTFMEERERYYYKLFFFYLGLATLQTSTNKIYQSSLRVRRVISPTALEAMNPKKANDNISKRSLIMVFTIKE